MSHIVIDAREWSTTTGRYVRNLVWGLEKIDKENNYSILLYPKDMDSYKPANERFTKVECNHKEFTLDEQTGLKKQIESLKPDLVHFPMVQQPAFYKGKVVTTMNDLTTTRFRNPTKNMLAYILKQQVYKWLNKRVARKSNALIAYSQFVKDDVAKFAHVNPQKITVINLAADKIEDADEPIKDLEGKQFIMYIGRPLPHKNLPRLVEAFVKLKADHPDLLLVLAGKLDENYQLIQKSVEAQGIEGVVFTDRVSEGQLRWLYENTAAYVFPSLSEGFGLPGLEAMAAGAPVASSNATCLPEIYGEAASYFDPRDVRDMTYAINDILIDPLLKEDFTEKGRKQVKKYSWQKCAEQTLEVYKKVLG